MGKGEGDGYNLERHIAKTELVNSNNALSKILSQFVVAEKFKMPVQENVISNFMHTYCDSYRVKERCFEESHFTARSWIRGHCWVQEVPCIVGIVTNNVAICLKNEKISLLK